MNFNFDPHTHCAGILLDGFVPVHTHELTSDVLAFCDADGSLVQIELLDTRPFGDPFDEAAALRAIEWVRARLALDAVS